MKSYATKFKSFQRKIVQMGALQKLQSSIPNPYNFVACLPNQYKLSILGDIIFEELPLCHFPISHTLSQSSHVSVMACVVVMVKIWPSGSNWLIFLQTRKAIWLGRLIANMEFKVIPEFCIAHSYCARFLRHQRAHMSAHAYKTWEISLKLSSIAR